MAAKILSPTPANIRRVAEALQTGQVVGMPTETVYGLAGSAFDTEALARIFAAKERPTFDPLIIHVGFLWKGVFALSAQNLVDLKQLSVLAAERAEALIQAFWPGPLTLVLPKNPRVPDLATSGLTTVALRMPRHPVAQALIAQAGIPLAAPSANRFGKISPTSARHVFEELGDRIEYILDGGDCEIGLESTVLSIDEPGNLALLRPGAISAEKIAAVAGIFPSLATEAAGADVAIIAPGMLKRHYAPNKPLYLLPRAISELTHADWDQFPVPKTLKIGVLAFSQKPESVGSFGMAEARVLSEKADLHEAARNLFSQMRALDGSEAAILFAEPCPVNEGLGFAINDRLKRAATDL